MGAANSTSRPKLSQALSGSVLIVAILGELVFFKFYPEGGGSWLWLNFASRGALVITALLSLSYEVVRRRSLPLSTLLLGAMFALLLALSLIRGESIAGPILALSVMATTNSLYRLADEVMFRFFLALPLGTLILGFALWPILGAQYFRLDWSSEYLGEFPFFMGITGHPTQFGMMMLFGLIVVAVAKFSAPLRAGFSVLFFLGVLSSGSDGAIALAIYGLAAMSIWNDLGRRGVRKLSSPSLAWIFIFVFFSAWSLWLLYRKGLADFTSGRTANWNLWAAELGNNQAPSVDPHVAWLNLYGQAGVLGVILAAAFFAVVAFQVARMKHSRSQQLAIGLFVVFFGTSFVESAWSNPHLGLPVLGVSIIAMLSSRENAVGRGQDTMRASDSSNP